MSISVVAVPYVIAWTVGALATASAVETISAAEFNTGEEHFLREPNFLNSKSSTNSDCEDVKYITEEHFLEKSMETVFMDKTILLKTLEEHGIKDIQEEFGKISGKIDSYTLSFERMEEDKPYFMTISYLEKNNPQEKLDDLSSEYALNVQEESYMSIVKKLMENNMQIEDEEVQEDNTIVITVNLD